MEIKWTDRQYHFYYNADVSHKYVIMYCNTNQFLALTLFGPHSKPRCARGLIKHYHLRFDTKLGNGVCAIRRISSACVSCTKMLEKPWIYGILSDK